MKKDKSVLIPNPSGTRDKSSSSSSSFHHHHHHHQDNSNDEDQLFNTAANDFHLPTASTRNGSSKYDFVKARDV
nr:P-loop NTPase domain-containing protein LPA1 homolog 1-like [Tanacetum cinerariifolium]